MKQRHWIDSHKGATPIFILCMIAYFNRWESSVAWLYLATHGLYGLLWVLKSRTFPDKQWEQECSLRYGLYIWAGLSLYWITPFLICQYNINIPAWLQGVAIATFGTGIFYHFVSDMQKHMSLELRPGVLVKEGLWGNNRNPNYFGELMIYVGFGLLAGQLAWIPLSVIAIFLVLVWVPNMLKKDKSLSRYEEFSEYQSRSKLILPFII